MANEKRLIDANAFLKSLEWECGDVCEQTEYSDYLETEYGFSRDAISQLVQKTPTVDAVEVVRCKDCRKWEYDENFSGWCTEWRRRTLGNHFCSYGDGERKDNGR